LKILQTVTAVWRIQKERKRPPGRK
jgi:hypothetical protein